MLYLLACVCRQVYAYDFAEDPFFFHNHRDLMDSFLLFAVLFTSFFIIGCEMHVREIPVSYIVGVGVAEN